MSQYSFDSLKPVFNSTDVVYEWELPVISDDEKGMTAMVILGLLPGHIKDQYESFLDSLHIPFDDNFCVGKLVYNAENELVYFGFPSIGISDNKPHLKIGDKGGEYTEITFVPLEFDGDYKIMGHRLTFVRVKDADGKKTVRVYFEMDVKGGDSFLLPIRTEKEPDFDHVKKCFDTGILEKCLLGFSANYGKATTFFKPSFLNGEFPSSGVLLELSSCRYSQTEFNGQTIESINFRIVHSSHPTLFVQSSAKEPVQHTLNEIGLLTFGKSTQPFSLYENGIIDADSTIWIHFYAPATDAKGNPNYEWTPKHTASKVLSRLTKAQPLFSLMGDSKVTLEPAKEKQLAAIGVGVEKAKVKSPESKSAEPRMIEDPTKDLLKDVPF